MSTRIRVARVVRRFNRFYTARMGLLTAGHLASPYSLVEVRVLHELAHRPRATAGEIGLALSVDAGYMSRIVAKLRRARLIATQPAAHDARPRILTLTARGRGVGARLVNACVTGAHEAKYQRLTLWTNDVLVAARRLYQRAGFTVAAVEPHDRFGKSLVSQTWNLQLQSVKKGRSTSPQAQA